VYGEVRALYQGISEEESPMWKVRCNYFGANISVTNVFYYCKNKKYNEGVSNEKLPHFNKFFGFTI